MKFELRLAIRHLRSSGGQTVLLIVGVAVAVTLVVFISSLIYGVQRRLIADTTGSIPLITVEMPEADAQRPRDIAGLPNDAIIAGTISKRPFKRDTLSDWRFLEKDILSLAHVTAVAPIVEGQGLATHAGREASVLVIGSEPEKQNEITGVSKDIIRGRYVGLTAREAVIGLELADQLGLELGDRLRIVPGTGNGEVYRITGLLETGQETVDSRTVYLNLRAAQTLFDRGAEITSFAITLDELFVANDVADLVQNATGLEAKSWMRENSRILTALQAQSSSSLMISTFSLIAAGVAIASVLIVSVLRRSSEIGILKSMGAQSQQILRVFTLEAIGVALLGSALGTGLSITFLLLLRSTPQPNRTPGQEAQPLFPIVIDPRLIIVTVIAIIIVAVIASIIPARRAANLDPIEVLRGG